jgi:hypothetical protein
MFSSASESKTTGIVVSVSATILPSSAWTLTVRAVKSSPQPKASA